VDAIRALLLFFLVLAGVVFVAISDWLEWWLL
jgi:hypothetical protein